MNDVAVLGRDPFSVGGKGGFEADEERFFMRQCAHRNYLKLS
jgi:hypothetical protein